MFFMMYVIYKVTNETAECHCEEIYNVTVFNFHHLMESYHYLEKESD